MGLNTFDLGAILLLLAALVGLANDRWFGLPRNIALLLGAVTVAALVLAADAIRSDVPIANPWQARMESANLPSILLDGVLALLLFASALHADPRELRARALPVLLLATLGVIIATAVFGLGLHGLTHLLGSPIPLTWCLVLGALLAPTDAVVVEGLLRQVPMPPALRGMISGESLFNDGAAVVVFLAALAIAAGDTSQVGHGRLAARMCEEAVGGGLIGWSAGLAAAALSRGLRDPSLEFIVTLALALGSYRLAAGLDLSAPIAVVAAGIAWRHAPRRVRGQRDPDQRVAAGWGTIDDLLNTWLFLLMGFQLLTVHPAIAGLALLPAVFLLTLAARLISVGVPVALSRLPAEEKPRAIAALTWTGLRGGISVALALTLPHSPWQGQLLTLAYAVVVLSIVIQGLSVPRVLRRLYPPPSGRPS